MKRDGHMWRKETLAEADWLPQRKLSRLKTVIRS